MNSRFRFAIALSCFIVTHLFAADSTLVIRQWLVTGPLELPMLLFADSTVKPENSLETLDFSTPAFAPAAGAAFDWSPVDRGQWEKQTKDTLKFKIGGMAPFTVYAASYVESQRRQELSLSISCGRPVAAWLDGKLLGKQTSEKDKRFVLDVKTDLHSGKHLLLVKFTSEPDLSPQPIALAAGFKVSLDLPSGLSFSVDPKRELTEFSDWADFQGLTAPAISSDGNYAAVVRNKRNESLKLSSWIEIFATNPARLVATLPTPSAPSALFFMPNSAVLAYKQGGDAGTSIQGYNVLTGTSQELMRPTKNVDKLVCSADGKFFYYFQDDDEEDNKTGYEKFDDIEDRVGDFTRRRHLVEFAIESGAARTLNELGSFALNEMALSQAGTMLAFTRYVPRVGRPYYDTELWVYDLKKRDAALLVSLPLTESIGSMCWLPGEKEIVYAAGAFSSLPTDTVFHNVNQHVLFKINIASKQIVNLTPNAKFSIQEGDLNVWTRGTEALVTVVNLEGRVELLQATNGGTFQRINTANSYVEQLRIADNGSRAVYLSSRLDRPMAFWTYDFVTHTEKQLLDPNRDWLSKAALTSYEKWTFTDSDGYLIDGWILKPLDFDPARKYPLIVYYYGGVSPRDEKFSFTYQWWCANDYVVYILNPRGCTGYGQEFADFHSNDWGTKATQDVIEGTQKVLAENSYLDPKRIGAYGGSYGGFITLDLATKTDMFTALVDMYGISNITSYFGGGTWGYWYGDLALPGSLPWKNKDIFVEKSPLYHADKINTPMLILHGAADNNVPPVESEQMFMALKILGKDVTLVKFDDENHNIIVKFENLITHREMMLEFFDKYLKGEPEGWDLRWKK